MGKNLQNDQNWPFWANLTDFFGKIRHCGSFWASLVWKESKKLKNSKNLPMYIPPRNANFWDFGWNEMPWWQNMVKVVNCMKMAIQNESEPHYGEKPLKWPELAILSQSNWLFWQNLPLWVIFSQFGVKGIQKVEKLKKFGNVHSPQKCKFLRFRMKWDTLVSKYGKSCELHENGHSEWIWVSLWGKTCKMTRIGHFEPI